MYIYITLWQIYVSKKKKTKVGSLFSLSIRDSTPHRPVACNRLTWRGLRVVKIKRFHRSRTSKVTYIYILYGYSIIYVIVYPSIFHTGMSYTYSNNKIIDMYLRGPLLTTRFPLLGFIFVNYFLPRTTAKIWR